MNGCHINVSGFLNDNACEVTLKKNGASGKWDLEVFWNDTNIGNDGLSHFSGTTIDEAMANSYLYHNNIVIKGL